jgi:hypothetical protein
VFGDWRNLWSELEAEKTKLLHCIAPHPSDGGGWPKAGEGQNFDETLKAHFATINIDLATARERLSHYEAQVGRQN